MTELSLYAIDGLFHNIVKQSSILGGRYAVLEKGAGDLNLNTLLSGLELPKEKFPGAFCLPPISELESTNNTFEEFAYRMLFLDSTYHEGTDIAEIDRSTNSSMKRISKCWNRMKTAALNFIRALEIIQEDMNAFHLSQKKPIKIFRISKMQNDEVSGVLMMFSARLATGCEFIDVNMEELTKFLRTEEGQFILNENGSTL